MLLHPFFLSTPENVYFTLLCKILITTILTSRYQKLYQSSGLIVKLQGVIPNATWLHCFLQSKK